MDTENQILVIAEHNGSELDPVTCDLIAWGAQIAAATDLRLGVLVLGSGITSVVDALRKSPVDMIFAIDDTMLGQYNADFYVQVIASALKCRPRLVMLGYTYFGIEMSSGLASKLDADLWNNCSTIKATPLGYAITRPILKGTYVAALEIKADTCTLITLQRGSSCIKRDLHRAPQLVNWPMPTSLAPSRIKVVAETNSSFSEDIANADLLVAVGSGIGQQSNIAAYQELAQVLGGSIAASRPLVDRGWLPEDHLVGISGRTVRPKVYLACGISGAMQHMAGMKDARVIIAINEDANAPIFQIAHYGIVGDINQLVPALIDEATRTAETR